MARIMSRRQELGVVGAAVVLLCAAAAQAGPPKDPPTRCAPDAVLVGAVCVDKYEASVWRIPATTAAGKSNAGLIKKVRQGRATVADLTAGGATQLGTSGDNYAPCTDNGQNCANDIYAVSLPGVTPARFITWFQALEACTNAGKRLPSNAEWQAAANGTPDGAPCNVSSGGVAATGAAAGCVSARGAFDMVGNAYEWVADWVPRSTVCTGWASFSDDSMCLAGADTATGPGALLRGGTFDRGTDAGPLDVSGGARPSLSNLYLGFRCAR